MNCYAVVGKTSEPIWVPLPRRNAKKLFEKLSKDVVVDCMFPCSFKRWFLIWFFWKIGQPITLSQDEYYIIFETNYSEVKKRAE